MSEEIYPSTEQKSVSASDQTWFKDQTKRTLTFSAPLNIVRRRLSSSFRHPIADPDGLFNSTVSYTGSIIGNRINLEYQKSGTSPLYFNMTGELFEDGSSSILLMTVKTSTETYLSLSFLCSIFILLFYVKSNSFALAFIPFFYLCYIFYARTLAADRITKLLYKIVERETYNYSR